MNTSSSVKRPAGSDGSDHVHREKVALHYKTSASNKKRLRILLGLPIVSAVIIFSHIMQKEFGISFTKHVLPAVEIWEYFFLTTPLLSIIGWMSLKKNRADILTFYIFSSVVFSICPLIIPLYSHASALKALIFSGQTKMYLFGRPFPTVLYVFLGCTLAMIAYSLHVASLLVKAWNTKGFKLK